MIKGTCDFTEGSPLLYVRTLPGLEVIGIVVMEINCFKFITRPYVTMWSYSKPPLCHRPWGSDRADEIVYVTLQDQSLQDLQGSGDFMEGIFSMYIPTLPKIIAIDIVNRHINTLVYQWYYKTM